MERWIQIGETQSRTCWVICDSVPVCVAIDRLRPCTSAEVLAFHYTQTKSSSPLADAQTQQGFNNERASLHNPTVADPPRTADEDEDEDEQDDHMSEPTQNNEDRRAKEDADGRNYKRVTGTVAFCCFVTREFIETFRRNTRTARTLCETSQNCKKKVLKSCKMSLVCSKRGIANIRETDSFK